eukprot:CAMPEP_0206421628 /NCGR_PEP_ID=MMETSP0324_2-20121206/1558_1 /ASSEMBLY_ACC=CAM_ASM_000836 /TAXON_ID=2866 /ORGANISM="Crypthecodinium cohnii, Strain Seligo" /LENGTH=35 /DNA_ID= /DNA_START= /DNA_END= /DNA_ORIENTATION=
MTRPSEELAGEGEPIFGGHLKFGEKLAESGNELSD